MRSIACAACGAVRWDSALRCPECGSATTLPEPPTSLVAAPPPGPRRRILTVPWRDVPDAARRPANRRRERLEIAIALLIVGILAATLFYYDAPHFEPSGPAPQVIFADGTVYPTYGDNGYGAPITARNAGTLEGGFRASNVTVEVCVSTYDDFGPQPPQGYPGSACPSNASYSSGFVASGMISVTVPAGVFWLIWVPSGSFSSHPPNWNVTWSPALESVPG
jgi:hypothetical protein